MSNLRRFKIVPILGRKTDVPSDDKTLFKFISDDTALTHDVGGINFDLRRKRNACTKSQGYDRWSSAAIGSATGCQGLFELEEGNQRRLIFFEHGNCYV